MPLAPIQRGYGSGGAGHRFHTGNNCARLYRASTGLERDQRVALFMPNCPQLVIGFFAIWRAGCAAVPVNAPAKGPELTRQLSGAGAAAPIALDRLP